VDQSQAFPSQAHSLVGRYLCGTMQWRGDRGVRSPSTISFDQKYVDKFQIIKLALFMVFYLRNYSAKLRLNCWKDFGCSPLHLLGSNSSAPVAVSHPSGPLLQSPRTSAGVLVLYLVWLVSPLSASVTLPFAQLGQIGFNHNSEKGWRCQTNWAPFLW
jgi:hypothetical protein